MCYCYLNIYYSRNIFYVSFIGRKVRGEWSRISYILFIYKKISQSKIYCILIRINTHIIVSLHAWWKVSTYFRNKDDYKGWRVCPCPSRHACRKCQVQMCPSFQISSWSLKSQLMKWYFNIVYDHNGDCLIFIRTLLYNIAEHISMLKYVNGENMRIKHLLKQKQFKKASIFCNIKAPIGNIYYKFAAVLRYLIEKSRFYISFWALIASKYRLPYYFVKVRIYRSQC